MHIKMIEMMAYIPMSCEQKRFKNSPSSTVGATLNRTRPYGRGGDFSRVSQDSMRVSLGNP